MSDERDSEIDWSALLVAQSGTNSTGIIDDSKKLITSCNENANLIGKEYFSENSKKPKDEQDK